VPLNNQYIIGVDGGGTKTRAIIGTKEGNILAFMDGHGTNIKSTPAHEVRQHIQHLLESLVQKISATKYDVSTIFLCVAGGDRQEDIKRWKAWIAPMLPSTSCKVTVTNDAVAALTSGTFTREGLVVIAGTGSIVYAVQQNSISRMGGWGYLLGDEGSGYYIGQEALRAITRQYDAYGLNEDAFSKAILERLALTDPTEIITLIYEHTQPRICISSITRTVLLLATQNNEIAKRIVDRAVTHLVQLLQMMFRKEPQVKKFPIVTCGGLFENQYFVQCFQAKLQQSTIDNQIIQPEVPPAIGAFINGLFSEGIPMTKALQQTVKETWMNIKKSNGGI
jgi:N-acetylglucosamine kinase-like BadF-type ATPase